MQLLDSYPSPFVCNLLQTSHLQSLSLFDNLDECARFAQTVVRTSVKPCKSSLQWQHLQLFLFQILLVDCCYLQFAASTRFDVFGYLHRAVRVEILAHNSVVRLRFLWLFFNAKAISVCIKFSNAVSFRVVHVISEHGCQVVFLCVFHTLSEQ